MKRAAQVELPIVMFIRKTYDLRNHFFHCLAGFLCAFRCLGADFLSTFDTLLANVLAGVDGFVAYVLALVFHVSSFVGYFATNLLGSRDVLVRGVFGLTAYFAYSFRAMVSYEASRKGRPSRLPRRLVAK